METPVLQNRIKDIQTRVAPYSNGQKFVVDTVSFSFNSVLSSYKTYLGVVIGVLFLLLFFRPSFITVEKPDKKGVMEYSLSFKKLLQYWLIISVVLIVGLYTYNYKMKMS